MKYDLSVIITARNEEFLSRTVDDVIAKKRGNTEVIVILDGNWANPPITDHPDVTIIYHCESIGQRAAINEAARLSTAKFIMKLDAHCILDEGFDVKLMKDCEYNWTVIPRMYNVHAFDWVCQSCGFRKYQSPTPEKCEKCNKPTMKREMIWKPRWHKRSDFMRFDSDLHFQYWGGLGDRPESKGELAETMSFVGACFFMHRQRYWDLDGSEEVFGSWGQQGTEISCKTWLSGGRVIVNKKTWFAHMFRTQGGDFGFPYPQSGRQVENARKLSKDMFLNNKFKRQIRPLSWLIEHFYPIPGWTDEDLRRVKDAGAIFSSSHSFTNSTDSLIPSTNSNLDTSVEKGMSVQTMGFSGSKHIISVGDQFNMTGVTTPPIVADKVVKLQPLSDGDRSNKPSVHESVNPNPFPTSSSEKESSISGMINHSFPIPTSSNRINFNVGEETRDGISVKIGNSKEFRHGYSIPQNKGIIYYTDNQVPFKLGHLCRSHILKAGLPIVSASLKPMNFGKNIVLGIPRGYVAYHKQILAALEASTADIIFFCEHDVFYHPSHFEFTPPKKDVYYYNFNWWRVRCTDGHAIHYDTHQVNFIVAYRDLLIAHYKEKVRRIEATGFTMAMGFEPGCNSRDERIDDVKAERFDSAMPNLDLRYGGNLTKSRWKREEFRNERSCRNWKETELDKIEGWELPIDTFTRYSK